MHSLLNPNAWVVLRLPSDSLKVLQVTPNTVISLGKYGSFSANYILYRPYNLTYELLDRALGSTSSGLRIVPASELHADTIAEEAAASTLSNPTSIIDAGDGVEFQLVSDSGELIVRSNRETIDDSARQTLTMEEIEELKREGTGAGKDLIAKLMLSHTGLDQKTAFSLAKYKLLKTKKYLRRFTVLPLDVAMLCHWMAEEKDAIKILEIREEMLALTGSWSNVHFAAESESLPGAAGGRWLVVDETGGLLVAAMAERMGILYPENEDEDPVEVEQSKMDGEASQLHNHEPLAAEKGALADGGRIQENGGDAQADEEAHTNGEEVHPRKHMDNFSHPFASSNALTLIHTNTQPNLSLLSYFHYNPNAPSSTTYHTHPLASHLLPLSWLQLISPELDTTYSSPPPVYTFEQTREMKSGKRGTYYRKLRRYNRTKHIVDSTLAGDFDGLAIASSMAPESILRHVIPLLRGGAPIAIYSPTIEPLVQLADLYSTSRRTAFIQSPPLSFTSLGSEEEKARWAGDEDFPLNPTLVLNASVQTARVRDWQVLPGRTHPLMTGRGGADGYLFTGVRVRPAEGRVEARGKFVKKKEKAIPRAEEAVVTVDREEEDNGDVEMADS